MNTDIGVTVGCCRVISHTDKALLVKMDDDDAEYWIPKSQIHDDSEVFEVNHKGLLVVSTWFAEARGWA